MYIILLQATHKILKGTVRIKETKNTVQSILREH